MKKESKCIAWIGKIKGNC